MTTTYLETLVLEDAARREPLDLSVRMYYLIARADGAADDAERNIIQRAALALRNGCHDAAKIQGHPEPDGYRVGDGGNILPTSR